MTQHRAALALIVLLAACGMETRRGDDGAATTSVYLGTGSTLPAPCTGDRLDIIEASRFGLWSAGGESGLGFSQSVRACVPQRCHAVLLVQDRAAAESLRPALAGLDRICLIERTVQ
jgi:hypothetical protein